MREVTFEQFTKDYNEYYQCDVRFVRCSSDEVEEIIDNLYDNNDFEVNYDNETIELY